MTADPVVINDCEWCGLTYLRIRLHPVTDEAVCEACLKAEKEENE